MAQKIKEAEHASPPVVGRERARPWYEITTLMGGPGEQPEFVYWRQLPEDTYLPQEYVIAVATASVWWEKAINVSWIQMENDESRGDLPIPIQQHSRGAVIFYVEDDLSFFGIAAPESLEPLRVNTNCVTDIDLCLDLPDPESPQQRLLREHLEREAHEAGELASVGPLPAGYQLDG